jgi:hypothetical protein
LGFINRVDRIAKGMPVGFLSFVRHGGYKALEYAFNEFYPYNLSYKTGVEQFYTFPMLSYNPKLTHSWAIGFGAGSILPMNESVYFNPELTTQNVLSGDFEQLVSLGLNFGHAINEHANLLVGTSLVWNQTSTLVPQFSLRTWTIDATDQLHLGLRAALRYRF